MKYALFDARQSTTCFQQQSTHCTTIEPFIYLSFSLVFSLVVPEMHGQTENLSVLHALLGLME